MTILYSFFEEQSQEDENFGISLSYWIRSRNLIYHDPSAIKAHTLPPCRLTALAFEVLIKTLLKLETAKSIVISRCGTKYSSAKY